jgi:hypothetical protein
MNVLVLDGNGLEEPVDLWIVRIGARFRQPQLGCSTRCLLLDNDPVRYIDYRKWVLAWHPGSLRASEGRGAQYAQCRRATAVTGAAKGSRRDSGLLAKQDTGCEQSASAVKPLEAQLEPAIDTALALFPGVDRTIGGYEGLNQAQAAIADNAQKEAFGTAYSVVSQLWEAISPDPILTQHEADFRWLSDVYESVRPSDITGRLVWHALGAKTLDLINQHVHVEVPPRT